jgi:hypothetical protein
MKFSRPCGCAIGRRQPRTQAQGDRGRPTGAHAAWKKFTAGSSLLTLWTEKSTRYVGRSAGKTLRYRAKSRTAAAAMTATCRPGRARAGRGRGGGCQGGAWGACGVGRVHRCAHAHARSFGGTRPPAMRMPSRRACGRNCYARPATRARAPAQNQQRKAPGSDCRAAHRADSHVAVEQLVQHRLQLAALVQLLQVEL